MAAFTINSGGIVEWDSLSGGSVNATLDTYAISNNSTLRIATDSYQCLNHTTAFGSLDSVSWSGIGGKLLIDPTLVRVIPFNTGTGTVPAINTVISQGGVSGNLLGVWANWQSEPLAAAAAMPASGYIKIKSVSGGSFASGALTGISASATGPDIQGWIEVRGADTATINVPRVGTFETKEAWFELGETSGVRGQIIACPTTATIAGIFPGVWIETSPASGVYERYFGVGNMVNSASTPTDQHRGKIFWQTTAGIRLASDGTNNVGFLPAAGCKVRIPASIFTCCTRTAGSGSGPRVLPNATPATRQEFGTLNAGNLLMNCAVMYWYANFSQAYSVSIKNSAIATLLYIGEIATAIDLDNVIVGETQVQGQTPLTVISCKAGGTVKDSVFARANNSLAAIVSSNNKNIEYLRVKGLMTVTRAANSVGGWTMVNDIDGKWTDCWNISGRMAFSYCIRPIITNTHHADQFFGTTTTTNAVSCVNLAAGTTGAVVDGIDFGGLTNVHPYDSLVICGACSNIKVRNIGTFASPLNLGSANATGLIVNTQGDNTNVEVKRCYTSNTRTGLWSFVNSDDGITIENVYGDYADTTVVASLNSYTKAVGRTGATTGQVSVYGTHWADSFTSLTAGKIEILFNEPTTASASQCYISAGTPQFNSSGSVALTTVGDQIILEMPYFALGHTAFAALAVTPTGTNALTNHSFEFQADIGSGYTAWATFNQANLTGLGAIDPTVGFKLKVRITCTIANAGNLLTNIAARTVSTSIAQSAALYPLDVNTLTLTGLPAGTDVVILTAGTSTILAQQDANAGSSYAFTYSGAQTVDVGLIKEGYVPFYIRNLSLGTSNSSIPVAMTVDRNFI